VEALDAMFLGHEHIVGRPSCVACHPPGGAERDTAGV
jgi:hypothetical protein